MQLDLGDDLRAVRDADIIASVTGTPRLIGPEHLASHHRLVVDSGFVPQPDGSVQGDVQREAYSIPQHLTPVPGCIGPVEMAVLMERLVHATANPDLPSWNYRGRPYLTRTEINATEHTGTRVSRLMRHSFPHRIGGSLAADHQSSAAHPPDQHGKTPERGHNQQAHTDWER